MSAVLRVVEGGWAHWCPGCERVHVLPGPGRGWQFNGSLEKPTFTPSFKHTLYRKKEDRETVCHYNVTDGVLHFHNDSDHELRGAVPMVPAPDGLWP